MTTPKTAITAYQIIDHGIDSDSYFPGCGVALTPYDFVVTGIGENFSEAIEDALDMMSQGEECDDIDFIAFNETMLADEGLKEWPVTPDVESVFTRYNPESDMDDCDLHYYVSIRYSVGRP
jgi:hypothetical protein